MKTRKKLLIALLSATCVTAGAFGLAACKDKDTTDAKDPDIYAVYTTYVAYAEANDQTVLNYEDWLKSIQGAQGPQGIKGDPGEQGEAGATWLSGAEAPASSAGKVGDFYLNTDTFDVFKKGADGWGEAICNIKGATGATGPAGTGTAGTDGATWLSGAEDPAAADGKVGDLYLNTTSCDVFKKGADGWGQAICNIKGATGADGSGSGTSTPGQDGKDGEDGEDGKDGKDGATWLSGEADPTEDTAGNVGDFYLNTSTFDVFKKGEEGWGDALCNIKGAAGIGFEEYKGAVYSYDEDTATLQFYLSGDRENIVIQLPISVHKHKYGDVTTLFEATTKSEGLGYKVCTNSDCGHVETVVLPILGTDENPLVLNDEIIDVTVYDETMYIKYIAPDDGYLVVSTEGQGSRDADCQFNVSYDDFNLFNVYNQGNNLLSNYYKLNDFAVKDGQVVYITATTNNYGQEEASLNLHFYSSSYWYGEEVAHTVTVTDADGNAISGAKVTAYSKSEGDYDWEDEATTDSNGVASFDLVLGYYYFSVEAEGYASVDVKKETVKVETLVHDLSVKLAVDQTEFDDSDGKYDLEAGKEYTLQFDGFNSFNASLSGGAYFDIISFTAEGYEYDIDEYFTTEVDDSDNVTKLIFSQYSAMEVVVKFTVSESCKLTIAAEVEAEELDVGTTELTAGTKYTFDFDSASHTFAIEKGKYFVSATFVNEYGEELELFVADGGYGSDYLQNGSIYRNYYSKVPEMNNDNKTTYQFSIQCNGGSIIFEVCEDCTITIS